MDKTPDISGRSLDQSKMPYQLPFPPEAATEIVVPSALPEDERVWVPQMENVWFRPLCLNAGQGYWINLLRVRKSGVLSRHRHPARSMASCCAAAGIIWSMTGRPARAATSSSRRARPTRWWCPTTCRR